MRVRCLSLGIGFGSLASVVAVLGACAADEMTRDEADVEADAAVNISDIVESGTDAAPEEACTDDCAYFPPVCGTGILCPNGPFDARTPGGAFDQRTQINVIRGRSARDVWAVGALGAIAHFDGSSWTRLDPGTRDSMRGVWLRGEAEIALSTLDRIYSRDLEIPDAGADAAPSPPGSWIAHGRPPAPRDYALMTFQSGWAAPEAEWLWAAMAAPSERSGLWRLRVSPSTNAFEIGYAVPPDSCRSIPCDDMLAVHGASANDLWAVGLMGAVIHVTGADGDAPAIRAFNGQTLNALRGVWAVSETEAWLVGANGVIRHYTGDPVLWNVVPDVPTLADLNAVWGSSASDIWAVGDEAIVLHYDGTSWSRVKVAGLGARRPKLTTVWMPEPGHVWIGGQGVILSIEGRP